MNELTKDEIAFVIYSLKGSASVAGIDKPFIENIITKINLAEAVEEWAEILNKRNANRVII